MTLSCVRTLRGVNEFVQQAGSRILEKFDVLIIAGVAEHPRRIDAYVDENSAKKFLIVREDETMAAIYKFFDDSKRIRGPP